MINWKEIVKDHGHNSRKELLENIYSEEKSTRKGAARLGISMQAFANALKDEGIPKLPRGGANYHGGCPNSFKARVQALSKEFAESHTIEEIIRYFRKTPTPSIRYKTKLYLKEMGFDVFYESEL